jgi:hypothetical protein
MNIKGDACFKEPPTYTKALLNWRNIPKSIKLSFFYNLCWSWKKHDSTIASGLNKKLKGIER